ncbi:hypothetical protein [Arthrobacter sp. MYb213]|uniref:hypothetical protein n=1 Tax=Arthrobacter sp. MYb213 TaxID=1848595 RepID=UPI000CFD898B|nr:hypothetical protein [Arthrobacter sp. MYb213]PRB69528.1 hypothetical protein CQ011_12255 [Arthrobacter sp. MYb213]
MADRLVPIDENYRFPAPLEARLAGNFAGLTEGKVPVDQLPTDALVTDANVAAQINGTQTGTAIDSRITTQATPLVQPIVADYIASSQVVVDAAAAAVNANPKIQELQHGVTLSGVVDMNTLTTPNKYLISSSVAGTLVNGPRVPGAGSVEVLPNGGSGITQRYQMNNGFNQPRVVERAGANNGTGFGAWVPMTSIPEPLVQGENISTLTVPGDYVASTPTIATSIVGKPDAAQGKPFALKVETSWTSLTAHRTVHKLTLLPYAQGELPRQFVKSFTQEGVLSDWVEDSQAPLLSAAYPFGHKRGLMRQESKLRRGGRVGTSGATPVALSFDHGFANFRDFVLPHLKRLGLPCSVAVNTSTLGSGESLGVSYAELQAYSLNSGVELCHHSRDHGDVGFALTNTTALRDKILGPIQLIEDGCPECVADAYIMPGVSGTQYQGFNAGVPYKNWWEHPAGRIIIDNFPVVTGILPGQGVPMLGEPVDGVGRIGWDSSSWATETRNRIQSLSGTGLGTHIYMHPSFINNGITDAAVVTMLEWLAEQRDAGQIEVLTVSGFSWADTSEMRMKLSKESAWVDDTTVLELAPLHEYLRGSQVMLSGVSSAGGQVTLTATSDAGGLNASVTQTVVAGGKARLCFSVPKSTTTITLTSTGGLNSREVTAV